MNIILQFFLLFFCCCLSSSLIESKASQMSEACPKKLHVHRVNISVAVFIDERSRVGKEQKIAMELAVQDFKHCVNLIQSAGAASAASGSGNSTKSDDDTESSGSSVKDSAKTSMSDEDWEDLDLRAASTIRLCLAKNVLANVHGISNAKELWEKLEALYQAKEISNWLYLKEQFHTLRMNE
ncbi:hypothetical protein DH2020_004085 [Rehmannia glutinosa]|uniref:Uncharacterized protein n=1 Tax=Rehmannia glutinosa TaxID=99300 RepID=A0ABR0XNP1_REHGL